MKCPNLGTPAVPLFHPSIAIRATSKSNDQKSSSEARRRNDVSREMMNRRDILKNLGGAIVTTTMIGRSNANAAVTDETDTFANTSPDSSYANLSGGPSASSTSDRPSMPPSKQSKALPSDEISISVPKSDLSNGLGLELGDISFRTNRRVYVKSILPNSPASKLGIQRDWIVVSINGQSAERTNAEGVTIMVSRAVKSMSESDTLELGFRDPSVFREKLQDLTSAGGEVTTQVAPAGDTTQRSEDGSVKFGKRVMEQTDQRVTVTQLIPPKMCTRGATTDDLLEISYLGTVVETGDVFDGSAVKINGKAIPGRGNDVSLFFVLGKQPFGQFPPGWDVGLEGICVGERRRLIIPPALAYGATGLPRRGIPPNATLQYDVTLVSINGLAIPQ